MYGYVFILVKKVKEGVDFVVGVEGILYQVFEILLVDVLIKMSVLFKDDFIFIIKVVQFLEVDVFLFGVLIWYGMMVVQMKVFFDFIGLFW